MIVRAQDVDGDTIAEWTTDAQVGVRLPTGSEDGYAEHFSVAAGGEMLAWADGVNLGLWLKTDRGEELVENVAFFEVADES